MPEGSQSDPRGESAGWGAQEGLPEKLRQSSRGAVADHFRAGAQDPEVGMGLAGLLEGAGEKGGQDDRGSFDVHTYTQ